MDILVNRTLYMSCQAGPGIEPGPSALKASALPIELTWQTLSDHYPIFTLRKGTQQSSKQTHITKKKRLKHNDWNYSIIPDSSTIVSDYKACFPVQRIKLNYKNTNHWIN